MIINLIVSLLTGILLFLFGLMPAFTAPSWLTYEMEGFAFTLGALVYKLGAWLPVDTIGDALVFVGTILPLVVTGVVLTWIWAMIPIFGKRG